MFIWVFHGKVGFPGSDKESVDQVFKSVLNKANRTRTCGREHTMLVVLGRVLGTRYDPMILLSSSLSIGEPVAPFVISAIF